MVAAQGRGQGATTNRPAANPSASPGFPGTAAALAAAASSAPTAEAGAGGGGGSCRSYGPKSYGQAKCWMIAVDKSLEVSAVQEDMREWLDE